MELDRREGKEGRKTEGNEWTTSTRKGNKGQGIVKGEGGKERGRNLGMEKRGKKGKREEIWGNFKGRKAEIGHKVKRMNSRRSHEQITSKGQ